MKRIESPEHFRELTTAAKKNGYKLSNCFFLPDAIRRMTQEGTLFYRDIDGGLLLLDDRKMFYRCYYYLSEDGTMKAVFLDKDAVIEFPFNGEMNDKQKLQVSKIEEMGFRLGRQSGMMSASPDDVQIRNANTEQAVDIAVLGDADGILDLLNRYFNPLYSFIPSKEEMESAIEEGRVIVIRDAQQMGAALVSSLEKKTACVNQIAVDSAYRRRGFGGALMQAYHEMYSGKADAFRHWVDLNNQPAVSMYKGFGYELSLRKANEYIMTIKGE